MCRLVDLQRLGPQLVGEVDQVFLERPVGQVERRLRRIRLRRRGALAGHRRRRYRPLLDGPHRLAGRSIEDEREPLLGDLGDGRDLAPVDGDVDEVGGRRQVVVPHRVVHELEVPNPLAGLGVEADQRVREQVVAGTVAAVVVGDRRADGQVDVAQLGVGAHVRPHVGPARPLPRVVAPGLVAELAGLRDGVEDPLHLAGADVVAAHVPRRRLLPARALGDGRADDDGVAGHEGGRADRVLAGVDGAAEAPRQVDPTVHAEVGGGLAGLRVDRDEPGPPPGVEQPGVLAVRPVREAPRQEAVHGGAAVEVEAGVVAPEGLAGRRIDGRDLPEVGGDVEHAVDHQGGDLVGVGAEPASFADDRVLGPQLLVDRRPGPGDPELVDVVGGDLVERCVLRVAGVAPVEAPLCRVGPGLGERHRRRRHGAHEQDPRQAARRHSCTDPSHGHPPGFRDYDLSPARTAASTSSTPRRIAAAAPRAARRRMKGPGGDTVEPPQRGRPPPGGAWPTRWGPRNAAGRRREGRGSKHG